MARVSGTGTYAETALDRGGRSSWGAIFAGAFVALALMALLTLLGLAVGMSAIDPAADQDPIGAVPTTSVFWAAITAIVSLGAGGYVAGRLAGVLHKAGSALHGATVWAVATIAAIWLGTTAVGGLMNLTGAALSKASTAVSAAAAAVVPEGFDLPDITNLNLDMEDLPEPVRKALQERGLTPENFRAELRGAFRDVISRQEQARAAELTAQTAQEIARSPSQAPRALDDLIDSLFGRGGVLSQEDRREAERALQNRLGISPKEVGALLDRIQARAEQYQQQATQALNAAKQQATQAAGAATDAVAGAAWGAFIALALALAAAIGGAIAGRPAKP